MRTRTALFAVVVGAALAAACGKDSCPTAAAYPKTGQTPACTGTTQQVSISLQMCEACSHTAPTCSPDLHSLATNDIFLDTRWEVCSDNSSCAAQACGSATCSFAVPAGSYNVQALTTSGTTSFQLTVSPSAASCSGAI
jgi:disulfide bond formation protein DsbB